MRIAVVVGSRADEPGQSAIAEALRSKAEVLWQDVRHSDAVLDVEAVVLLGDRHEIACAALRYRQACIPIAHIHAGEITGQEPDDTYRDVISRMSEWLFVPHEGAYWDADGMFDAKVFNCGSPYITSAANTKLIDTEDMWPDGNGPKLFMAFNPLPEDEHETKRLAEAMRNIVQPGSYRAIVMWPNTDRYGDLLDIGVPSGYENCSRGYFDLKHQQYLSLMNDCDVMVGNSSSGLVEGSYFGVPYVCVGSRQRYRVHGANAVHCEPEEMADTIKKALKMGRKPNAAYGDKDSAKKIAETLVKELNG